MFIFGISLEDHFGIEFISNFFKEIKIIISNTVDYLTNTSFYTYLHKLFSKDEEIPSSETTNKNGSDIISKIGRETKTNENEIRQSDRNSKISE
jgi:hypothetical protein